MDPQVCFIFFLLIFNIHDSTPDDINTPAPIWKPVDVTKKIKQIHLTTHETSWKEHSPASCWAEKCLIAELWLFFLLFKWNTACFSQAEIIFGGSDQMSFCCWVWWKIRNTVFPHFLRMCFWIWLHWQITLNKRTSYRDKAVYKSQQPPNSFY